MSKPRRTRNLDLFRCADLGLRLGVAVALGTWGGHRLDQWLDCSPIGLIAGSLAGLSLGMATVIRTVLRAPPGAGKGSTDDEDG